MPPATEADAGPRRWPGVTPTVLLLGLTSLLADVSGELLFAVLPFFVVSTGGGALAVGLAGGIGDAVAHLGKVVSGYLSDSLGKRTPLVMAGYGMSALAKVALAFAAAWPVAVGLRALERVGKGIRTAPRDALLAESAPAAERGRAFGFHRAMDSAGAVLGSGLALLLVLLWRMPYDRIVLLSGFIGVLTLVPLLFVREVARARVTSGLRVRLRGLPPGFLRYMAVAALFGLGNVTVLLFMLRASPAFPEGWRVAGPILLYILFNATSALVAFPMGILADRVGRPRVLALGFLLFSLTALAFAFAETPGPLTVLFVGLGVAVGVIDGTERALAADFAGPAERGTALGVYAMVTGVASVGAGFAAGLLWDFAGPSASFVYAALLSGTALAVFVALGALRGTTPREA